MRTVLTVVTIVMAVKQAAMGQFALQDSGTKAGLRGIHSLGGGLAWASGTGGTILRTTDGGASWQKCAVPNDGKEHDGEKPDGEKLDFRGIQGLNAETAIAMSSGPGALSRVYRTTDGCKSWKLVLTNPDPEGFWDAIRFSGQKYGLMVGDPVDGRFPIFRTEDGGESWNKISGGGVKATAEKQGVFAASNSSLLLDGPGGLFHFITGGAAVLFSVDPRTNGADSVAVGMSGGESGGGFSLASTMQEKTTQGATLRGTTMVIVAVGGDYKHPEAARGTAAAWRYDRWLKKMTAVPVEAMPSGFRSAVAYDAASKTWLAVGPDGTDVSRDDGRRWRAVKPGAGEAADADKNWNALSLPFVVGPEGRIGKWSGDTGHRR